MKRSYHLTRIANIDVSVHWTFFLFLGMILYSKSAHGLTPGLIEVGFVVAAFGCVLLHELGHAMAARIFGIPTHGITLLPIGGVAHLDRIPKNAWQEVVIALAGPAVNVVIAAVLYPLIALSAVVPMTSMSLFSGAFMMRLYWINVMLVLFNMIPAFPMDGGRVLRAVVSSFTSYVTATRTAARIGQVVALGLAILGWYANPMLIILACFVVFAAQMELQQVMYEDEEQLEPLRVAELQPAWSTDSNRKLIVAEIVEPRIFRPESEQRDERPRSPVPVVTIETIPFGDSSIFDSNAPEHR